MTNGPPSDDSADGMSEEVACIARPVQPKHRFMGSHKGMQVGRGRRCVVSRTYVHVAYLQIFKKRSTLNIARLISNNSREPSFSRTKPLCDCNCFTVKNSLNVCYMPGSIHITYIFFLPYLVTSSMYRDCPSVPGFPLFFVSKITIIVWPEDIGS